MNKKLFSILVIIITLSLISISCSKTPTEPTTPEEPEEPTEEPETPTDPTTPEDPTDPKKLDLYVSGAGEKNDPIDIQIRVYGDAKLIHDHTSINSIGLAGKHKDLDGLIFKVIKIEDDTTVAGHKPSPEAISKIENHTKIEVDENKNIVFHEGLLVDGIFIGYTDLHVVSHEEYHAKYRSSSDKMKKLAFEMFFYRVRKYIGAYAFAMNGADAIVFTGGIGEHSPEGREIALSGLEFFGITLDKEANKNNSLLIGDGKVKVLVIPTNEELAVARETVRLIGRQ